MSIKSRIAKLEEAYGPTHRELTLPDGRVVSYRLPEDALDAIEAAIDDEPHFLVDAAHQMGRNDEGSFDDPVVALLVAMTAEPEEGGNE